MPNDLNRLGLFSETSYCTVGDSYVKKNTTDSRFRGKQFATAPPKSGKTNDVTFDKVDPLFVGEKYVEPNAEERRQRKLMQSQNVSSAAFRPSSPPKKSCGLGNYYGTIGAKYEHVDGAVPPVSQRSPVTSRPNIQTSPAKKGTYGVPGNNIGVYGAKNGTAGVVGEYRYMSEPYDAARQLELAAKKEMQARSLSARPWKPSSPPKKGTYGVPGTSLYSHTFSSVGGTAGVVGEYKYTELGTSPKDTTKQRLAVPFKPSHPPRSGYNATLQPFPEYKDDPLTEKLEREKAQRLAQQKQMTGPIFKPVSTPKSVRTPSIANNPLNRAAALSQAVA